MVENSGGITFISALSGLGAPYWNPDATGAIMGITRGTNKAHIARAALEVIALRSREIIVEMEKIQLLNLTISRSMVEQVTITY